MRDFWEIKWRQCYNLTLQLAANRHNSHVNNRRATWMCLKGDIFIIGEVKCFICCSVSAFWLCDVENDGWFFRGERDWSCRFLIYEQKESSPLARQSTSRVNGRWTSLIMLQTCKHLRGIIFLMLHHLFNKWWCTQQTTNSALRYQMLYEYCNNKNIKKCWLQSRCCFTAEKFKRRFNFNRVSINEKSLLFFLLFVYASTWSKNVVTASF